MCRTGGGGCSRGRQRTASGRESNCEWADEETRGSRLVLRHRSMTLALAAGVADARRVPRSGLPAWPAPRQSDAQLQCTRHPASVGRRGCRWRAVGSTRAKEPFRQLAWSRGALGPATYATACSSLTTASRAPTSRSARWGNSADGADVGARGTGGRPAAHVARAPPEPNPPPEGRAACRVYAEPSRWACLAEPAAGVAWWCGVADGREGGVGRWSGSRRRLL